MNGKHCGDNFMSLQPVVLGEMQIQVEKLSIFEHLNFDSPPNWVQGWFFASIKYFLPCQVAKIGIKWPKMTLNGLKWHKMAKNGIKWPSI